MGCKVSVLVPVCNVKAYLQECLDSLAAQTLTEIEFICIDDGSTDGSENILDGYAKNDGRFHVIHKENSGYGASMNVGLRAARGEYIGIVEPDDFADSGMFEQLFEVAKEHRADVVKSNFFEVTERRTKKQEILGGHVYGQGFCPLQDDPQIVMVPPSIWSGIYRKDFLMAHNIWFHETPGASFQDVSFFFLTMAYAEKCVLVKDAYLHYRMDNPGSSVHTKTKVYCIIDEYDAIKQFLAAHQGTREQQIWAAKMFEMHCYANEGRIDRSNLLPFWRQAIQRLQAAHESGWFDHEMIEHPEKWMFERISRLRERDFIREGFLAYLRSMQNCFIYGAGVVANGVLENLERHEISVTGFLVSRMKGNPSNVGNVPVNALQDASIDRKYDVVIIAVTPRKPEVQQEIFFTLEEAGYQNVIVLTEELQQALAGA